MPQMRATEDSRHLSLEQIGDSMNLTRERVRQIERAALQKMKKGFEERGISAEVALDYLNTLGQREWQTHRD